MSEPDGQVGKETAGEREIRDAREFQAECRKLAMTGVLAGEKRPRKEQWEVFNRTRTALLVAQAYVDDFLETKLEKRKRTK